MAGSRASTTRSGGGRPAIDRQPAPQLTERFAADLARLWPEGGRLGLAVSGGPDSVALLLLARAVRPEQIEAATVDHGLRVEAAAEAQFVAELCAGLGVPHTILKVAVAEGNVQARARAARYAALAEWVDARGLAALATAHHADDQAETLLLRLNRGSGAAGLAGVRERGRIAGSALTVIRPLLGWRRSELAEVVARAGIEAIEDPSNADERFDRVRIRRALREADWLDPAAPATSPMPMPRSIGRRAANGWRTCAVKGSALPIAPPPRAPSPCACWPGSCASWVARRRGAVPWPGCSTASPQAGRPRSAISSAAPGRTGGALPVLRNGALRTRPASLPSRSACPG
jgi:tRNA(Ile)-lysidine synthase